MGLETDSRFMAAFDLIGRTGAASLQIREVVEDGPPTVYVAVAEYKPGSRGLDADTREHGTLAAPYFAVAAGLTPLQALEALMVETIDGAECNVCLKVTAVSREFTDPLPAETADWFCWRQWDPELQTYRRSCEGDTPTKET